jgi:tryptophan synthase alpha chain
MNSFQFNHKAVGIFLTAYFPSKERFVELLLHLQQEPIDFIEIGIPFSDPIADGPVIQHSSEVALANGFSVSELFDLLDELQDQLQKPTVLMGYGNQVIQYGMEAFLQRCEKANIQALIFPDLPLEMLEGKYATSIKKSSVPFVHLVTPNTADERIVAIAKACTNSFVYLVGNAQTTGGSYALEAQLDRYAAIKNLCGKVPVFLGFGIDSREKKALAQTVTDGVIIGSAYLQAVKNGKENAFLANI